MSRIFHGRNHAGRMQYWWYLPTTTTAGGLQPAGRLEQALKALIGFGGGLTRFRPCRGYWMAPDGRLMQDGIIPVQVVTPARPDVHAAMLALAADMAGWLGQEEIFVLVQSVFHLPAEPVALPQLLQRTVR